MQQRKLLLPPNGISADWRTHHFINSSHCRISSDLRKSHLHVYLRNHVSSDNCLTLLSSTVLGNAESPFPFSTHWDSLIFYFLFSEMGLGTGQAEVVFLGLSFLFCQFCIQAIVHLTMRFSKRKQGTSITQRFLHSASWDCYGSSCNIPYSLFVTQVQEENNVVWPRREGLSTFSFFLHTSLFCSFQEAITCCFSFLHACFFFLLLSKSLSFALPLLCLILTVWFVFLFEHQTSSATWIIYWFKSFFFLTQHPISSYSFSQQKTYITFSF